MTDSLQAVTNILFELFFRIDEKYEQMKIAPVGFYEFNQLEAFITLKDVRSE